jgi:phosphoribosylanthranilate isomerase
MMVKVCGITRREDAEAAVQAGASALGFVFVPSSPRYVTPERAAELGEGLPILKVGVFGNGPLPAVAAQSATFRAATAGSGLSLEEIMRVARLDVAQIYGGAAPGGARVWKAFRVNGAFDLSEANGAEAVVLDGPANGISFDWSLARLTGVNVILAGGLDASNVAEAIRTVRPWGVDASSGLESSPGVKDREKVRGFIEAARKA